MHRLGDLPPPVDARYAIAIPRLSAIIRRRRPRVINAHYVTSFGVLSAMAVRLAHPVGARPPLVQTAWGDDLLVTPAQSRIMRGLVTFALREASLITGDAEALRSAALGMAPKTPVGAFIFGPSKALLERNDPKEHVVVSARHLVPEMRVDLTIRAFLHASTGGLNGWRMVVVGEGPMRSRLEALVPQGAPVEFRGAQPHETLQDLLARASISVSVPVMDGTSATLLESLAAATVPVVNDLPANREWVDAESGVVVGRDPSPQSLAKGLLRAAETPWDPARLRGKVADVTWESQVSMFADTLRRLASAEKR
jgi:glycosyltransferase involved in cell wall biosynthesis